MPNRVKVNPMTSNRVDEMSLLMTHDDLIGPNGCFSNRESLFWKSGHLQSLNRLFEFQNPRPGSAMSVSSECAHLSAAVTESALSTDHAWQWPDSGNVVLSSVKHTQHFPRPNSGLQRCFCLATCLVCFRSENQFKVYRVKIKLIWSHIKKKVEWDFCEFHSRWSSIFYRWKSSWRSSPTCRCGMWWRCEKSVGSGLAW